MYLPERCLHFNEKHMLFFAQKLTSSWFYIGFHHLLSVHISTKMLNLSSNSFCLILKKAQKQSKRLLKLKKVLLGEFFVYNLPILQKIENTFFKIPFVKTEKHLSNTKITSKRDIHFKTLLNTKKFSWNILM